MPKRKYKSRFQDSWLENPNYASWLCKVENDPFSARCRWCKKSVSVDGQGESALKSHMKGSFHQKWSGQGTLNISSYMSSKSSSSASHSSRPTTSQSSSSSTSQSSSSSASQSSSSSTSQGSSSSTSQSSSSSTSQGSSSSSLITEHITTENTLSAEVLWTLNTVNKHHSFNSNADTSNLFRRMFPDSRIAQSFGCGERKTSYMATDGIAPYIVSELNKTVKRGNFVIGFDESLNNAFQNKQLDVNVRLWDVNLVKTRYVSSSFMSHARAVDLLPHFYDLCTDFNLKNMIQVYTEI